MGIWSVSFFCILTIYFAAQGIESKFLNFKAGYEYVYRYEGHSSFKDLGKFIIKAKVSYTNIQSLDDGQELLLKVYNLNVSPEENPNTKGIDNDFSKWFSFVISTRGVVDHVYHPHGEEDEVVATKKGLASLFAAKLHEFGEIPGNRSSGGFTYHIFENGTEGEHNATYMVSPVKEGLKFKKTRLQHPVKNAKASFHKTMIYQDYLETIHSVLIEENFTSPKTPPGFDPYHGMRKVKAVNDFSKEEYPTMSYTSQGKLSFLTRQLDKKQWLKPSEKLLKAPIHVGSVKHTPKHLNLSECRKNIMANLTCIENQPEQGSPVAGLCFRNIVNQLLGLPDKEIVKIAEFYFSALRPTVYKYRRAIENMVDAFGAMNTELSERLLAEKVLLSPTPDHDLVKRVLTHVAINDRAPSEVMLKTLEDAVIHQEKFPKEFYIKDTHSRCMLALGAVSHKLFKEGQTERARKIMSWIHLKLGLHDPWEYRQKRAVMTRQEMEDYDSHKVILLETLGNARLDDSYDYILSHINSTNSPWIKRAGCHALRKYHHEHAAETLLYSALYDEEQSVRYEASLLYMAHPKGKMIAPMNAKEEKLFDNTTIVDDPYDSGVDVVDLTADHQRSRRNVWEGHYFRLEAPGVDWRKTLGTQDIGASFGVIMINFLNLAVAPTQGHLKIHVHDEAYARIHFGILDFNYDFFIARVCFQGGTEYSFNILQGNEMKKIADIALNFSKKLADIVNGIKSGVQLFKDLISGRLSLKKVIDDFVSAITSLPNKVVSLVEKSTEALEKIGHYDPEDLPLEFKPTINFVHKVAKLFSDIKTDVMGFVHAVEQSIKVEIPHQGKVLFESIRDIIEGFSKILGNPKAALQSIGKGVFSIFQSIKIILQQKKKVQEACFFLRDEKPYWFDVETLLLEYKPLADQAFASLKSAGDRWVNEKIEDAEDRVKKFTKGRVTLVYLRREAVQTIENLQALLMDPFNELLGLADKFVKGFFGVFGLIKKVKDAYTTLKEGYDTARGIIDALFGPKAHKNFPKNRRLKGRGCDNGFYPSSLGGGRSEYRHTGLDLLVVKGDPIVAPFGGTITVDREDSSTVIISAEGCSLRGITIFITNIEPNSTIDTEEGRSCAAGQPIGRATGSDCDNHIHLAFQKDGGYIDPTKFLESLMPVVPKWKQICDDYKLVFKKETIAAGVIVGLKGEGVQNKDPTITNTDKAIPIQFPASSQNPDDTIAIKSKPSGLFAKVHSSLSSALDFDTDDDQCPAIMGTKSSVGKRSLSHGKGIFSKLLKTADKFLEKFNIRRLKFGTIMEFLDRFGMTESKAAMARVMMEIKNIIDDTACINPYEMTEDQLVNELTERGKDTKGSREQLIERLVQLDKGCPLLSFTMPKNNVYCTFDSMCLGLECCINIKFAVFLKILKVWARFDPCASPQMFFTLGLDSYTYRIEIPSDITYDGYEGELRSGNKLNILGGLEAVIRYNIFKGVNATLVTFGVGLCSFNDSENCLVFINLLDNAVLPVPTCLPDGSLLWPKLDFKKLFLKEALYKHIKEQGKSVIKGVTSKLMDEFLKLLKMDKEKLNEDVPLPKPDKMTLGQITAELVQRSLSTRGSRSEQNERLTKDDLTCTSITLKEVPQSLSDFLYYKIQKDCLRIDVWVDINVKLLGYSFSRTLSAFIELDPCSFVVQIGFEKYLWTKVLLNYNWGSNEMAEISSNVKIMYSIGRNVDEGVFILKFGLMICLSSPADCILDKYLFTDLRIPIPVCRDFVFPGNGSFAGLLEKIGGKMTEEAFELVLRKFDLNDVITSGPCPGIPPSPESCPTEFDVRKNLPEELKKMVTCEQPPNCWGIDCCLQLTFNIPLGDTKITKNIPFWFKLDPCDFSLDVAFGRKTLLKTHLLEYEYGKQHTLTLGSGNPPPVEIMYRLDQIPGNKGFIVDLRILICFDFDVKTTCIPTNDGIHLLKNQEIPLCDQRHLINFSNFSLTDWMREKSLDLDEQLAEGAVMLLLDQLNLTDFFQRPKCDRTRMPYIPSIQGIHNKCPKTIVYLPSKIPDPMSCYIPDYCTGIECCADIPVLGLGLHVFAFLDLDKLELRIGMENIKETIKLNDYVWGEVKSYSVAEGLIKLRLSVKPITNENVYVFNVHASVCLNGGKCSTDIPILRNTRLPTIRAIITGESKNFSFTNWLHEMNITQENLRDNAKALLVQQLGIDQYLLDTPCDSSGDVYSPSVQGWKNECPLDWVVLPQITSDKVRCSLSSNCTRIDCCVDFSLLNLKLHFFLHFDRCNYVISGGIEKKTFSYGLLDFNSFWGREVSMDIGNVVFIKFKATQLEVSKKYVLDMGVSVCLEPDVCDLDIPILKEVLIPILNCDLTMDFNVKDFSLVKWMDDQGLSFDGSLSTALAAALFKKLGIDSFLKNPACERTEAPYSVNKLDNSGWSSDCPAKMSLPKIRGTTACYIKNTCTAIKCCLEVGKVSRTFEIELDIDFCNQKLTFGIEKLTETVTLQGFEYGKRKEVVIMGIVRMWYTIWDHEGEGVYVVTVDLAICFEDRGDCLINTNILNQFKLSKQACLWGTSFLSQDFSLKQFMDDAAITAYDQIKGLALDKLKEALGLPTFLNDPPCSLVGSAYVPNTNGIKKVCSRDISSLPTLPSNMVCQITESCTGVDCCIRAEPIHHNFHAYLDIDPCNFTIRFGIDKFQFQIYMQEYSFGIEKDVRLVNVVRIKFQIWDLSAENQYLINLRFSVCFDSKSACLLDKVIFHEKRLPKKVCDFAGAALIQDFSLEEWKTSLGLSTENLLPTLTDQLMEHLGIAGYLKRPQCSINDMLSSMERWIDKCPKSQLYKKPSLAGLPVLCSISSRCTEIHCCVQVKPIGRNFETYLNLDTCNKTLVVGIEQYRRKFSLHNYTFGTKRKFWLQNIIKIEYSIEDLVGYTKYLVNMKVEVCLERNKPCIFSQNIAKDMYLPKIECNWSLVSSEFSLSEWYKKMSLSIGSVLSATQLSILKEALGITNFLLPKTKQCNRISSAYKPESPDQGGWKIDCPLAIGNLTEITSGLPLSCHIKSQCTAIECCLDLQDPLQQTIHFFLDLDLCLQTLKAGIENYVYERTLFSFSYGSQDYFKLANFVQILYQIDEVKKTDLQLSLSVKICLEENTCVYDFKLLDKVVIPKPGCSWDFAYTIPDFSLKNWYNNIGASIGSQLSNLNAAKLLEELGIAKYTQEIPCQRAGPAYSPHVNGWKSDCQMEVLTSPIKDPVSCLIKDTCTAVSCCMDIDFLQRSFETYITLDACNHWILVGVEKLSFNLSLDDISFGTENKFYLNSVIRIDYKIEDMHIERQFKVSMSIKACFEASDDNQCIINIDIFKNTLLPKKICDWTEGFATANFSLSEWYRDLSLPEGSILSQVNKDRLLDMLGIRSYLNKDPCSFTSTIYSPANSKGWKNECKSGVTSNLPALPSTVRCNIPDYCTGVTCCLAEDSVLRHHFTVGVKLDDCNHILTFQIEKLKIEIALKDYSFGVVEKRFLMSVIQFEFKIDDKPLEKSYKISASLKICYGVGPCALDTVHLIQDFILPKTLCEWGSGFVSEFSLQSWLKDRGLDTKAVLSSLNAGSLFSSLGMSDFLKDPQCKRTSGNYHLSGSGWKNDCPSIPFLPALPSSVSCHIPNTCTSIDCCAEIAFLNGRSINVQVLMDPCEAIMSLNIEKMQYNITLFDYDFGTTDHFTLQGAIRIDFNIQNMVMEKKYLLNMNLSVCMETSDLSDCVYSVVIFHNTILPKQLCSMELDYLNPGFDLSSWKTLHGFGSVLTHEQAQKLLRELGVEEYVGIGCSRNAAPYDPETHNGWNVPTACKVNPPTLPSNINCYINTSCTGISCCFDDSITGTSYQISVTVDSCGETLVITLEKMKFVISLFDYPMGTKRTAQLFGILQLEYMINDLHLLGEIVVDLKAKLCFSKNKACENEMTILQDFRLPKPLCNFSAGGFAIPDFSLIKWMKDIGNFGNNMTLEQWAVDLLKSKLKLSNYMLDPMCKRSQYLAGSANWNLSACPTIVSVQPVPSHTSCALSSACSGIKCCTDIALLKTAVQFEVSVDRCKGKVFIMLEKLEIVIMLKDFKFSSWETYTIQNVFRLVYKIDYLSVESAFVFNIKFSACFESKGDCMLSIPIMQDVKISIIPCNFSMQAFAISGFSLNDYLISKGIPTSITSLSSILADQLLDYLGVGSFFNDIPCNQSNFARTASGFTLDPSCVQNVSSYLPTLPADTNCRIFSRCTAIQCCTDISLIRRTLNYTISIDACAHSLLLQIETFRWELSLVSFHFGKEQKFSIDQVFSIKYKITDLIGQGQYLIDMRLSVCFSDGSPCQLENTIVSNYLVSKPFCAWFNGFKVANFSYSSWLSLNKLSPSDVLSQSNSLKLTETLGLTKFLKTQTCNNEKELYKNPYQGWTSGCVSDRDISKPVLDSSIVTCHLQKSCTGVQCCVSVPHTGFSVETFVEISPCDHQLRVGIENLKFNKSLFGYKFGQNEKFDLFGLVVVDFKVIDLDFFGGTGKYLVNLNISVCLESGQPCGTIIPVFVNSLLPKQVCEKGLDFINK
ncbi:uncharacterized protein LOC134241150, partial [Saccostrea cucullata]|uniref:uncharacterized protein LOC134241150 n=1 Tax=Saccostrea cuccullata TaxID=36930 RepID=UPI002ED4508C